MAKSTLYAPLVSQDIARIETALEGAMRERLVEARQRIARDLHAHLDDRTRREWVPPFRHSGSGAVSRPAWACDAIPPDAVIRGRYD
jgi:hypothetical protein